MSTAELRQRVSPKRILVVEDEIVAALSIRTVLTADGHSVEMAQDAERALLLLQASPHDLVLTDFILPGMDGLELADTIKQRFPGMPIVLITAYAEKIGGGMGNISNVDLALSKPFSVADLQHAIQKVFPAS
jgi:CheY-like chemotaxis protein